MNVNDLRAMAMTLIWSSDAVYRERTGNATKIYFSKSKFIFLIL